MSFDLECPQVDLKEPDQAYKGNTQVPSVWLEFGSIGGQFWVDSGMVWGCSGHVPEV